MRQPGDRTTVDGVGYIAVRTLDCRGCAFNHGQEFTTWRYDNCGLLHEKHADGSHKNSCGRVGPYGGNNPQVIWLTEVDAALHRLTN